MAIQRNNKSFHVYPVLLDDHTHTATAATVQRTVKVAEKLAEKSFREGVPHGIGLLIRQDADMTYTTAPTQLGVAAAIDKFIFKAEKGREMFNLRGEDIRLLEIYEGGGEPAASDPDLNGASTNNLYSNRWLPFSPEGFEGAPSDFALPVALMENSTFELTYGALTDYSADTTAGTVRTRVYLVIIVLYEVRIPPKVEKRTWDGAGNKIELGDRALVTSLVLLNSASHDAITNGDFDTIELSDRKGTIYSSVPVEVLTALYAVQMGTGFLNAIQGEPEAATDDNGYVPNGATPTALTKPTAAYQPVVWSPPMQRLTKVEVESPLTMRWGGTQATAYAVGTRILPRSEQEARELADYVFRNGKLPFQGGEFKTLSKRVYKGPRSEYMPQRFSYLKAA